jgi:hypothetical protein
MSSYNIHAGEAVHAGRRFKPKGQLKLYHEGAMPNPTTRLGGGGYGARIFVGLNVGQKKAHSIDDIIKIVWAVRKRQKRQADASILAQHGIYEGFDGKRVVEPSAQVVLIDLAGTPKRKWVDEMKELSEELRKKLRQETVILEIQRRGVSTDVYSVTE